MHRRPANEPPPPRVAHPHSWWVPLGGAVYLGYRATKRGATDTATLVRHISQTTADHLSRESAEAALSRKSDEAARAVLKGDLLVRRGSTGAHLASRDSNQLEVAMLHLEGLNRKTPTRTGTPDP